MKLGSICLVLGAFSSGIASAQAVDEGAEWEASSELGLVVSTLGSSSKDVNGVVALVELGTQKTFVLENGVQITPRLRGRFEIDEPSRPSFSGVLGSCLAGEAACGFVSSGGGPLSPVSPVSGLSASGVLDEAHVGVFMERASVSVSGPWGEGIVGFDNGVAVLLDARAPQVLDYASIFSPSLDAGGQSLVRARNDVTGASAKLSYLSPRWLGLRAGVSYAPAANHRSGDFDPRSSGSGRIGTELENVWEGALSFSRRFRPSDGRGRGMYVRAALTGSWADSGADFTEFGSYEAIGAGLELSWDDWMTGVRWLDSNNAWVGRSGGHEAVEAGIVREIGDWRIGLEASWMEDDLLNVQSQAVNLAAKRKFNENVAFGAALSSISNKTVYFSNYYGDVLDDDTGLTLELSVRK